MVGSMISIRVNMRLADEAARILGVKNRTEAVHAALREIVALKKFKILMARHGGKLRFEGLDE
jgi:Arc/MetJ family transcription regulator